MTPVETALDIGGLCFVAAGIEYIFRKRNPHNRLYECRKTKDGRTIRTLDSAAFGKFTFKMIRTLKK